MLNPFFSFFKLTIDIRSILHVQIINNLLYNVYNCIVNGGGMSTHGNLKFGDFNDF